MKKRWLIIAHGTCNECGWDYSGFDLREIMRAVNIDKKEKGVHDVEIEVTYGVEV